MAEPTKDLESERLNLPPDRRARLAARLIDSLETDWKEPVDEVWIAETERRLDELESGLAQGIPASEVVAEARSKLR